MKDKKRMSGSSIKVLLEYADSIIATLREPFLVLSKDLRVISTNNAFHTAFEVSEKGDIASWKIPGKMVKGMGGAMDLVASAKNIIVAMQHTSRESSKLLRECTLPLTGVRCVKKIVTDLAVIEVTDNGFLLLERAPGVSVEEIRNATEGRLIVEGEIPEMKF